MSRFEKFQDTQVRNEKNEPLNGQIYLHDCIINFENGFISNWDNEAEGEKNSPAISCIDGHIEYWEKGKLHKDDGPAVYSADGVEYWKKGEANKSVSLDDNEKIKYKENSVKKAKELKEYFFKKGREAEIAFASYLNKKGILFIHLNQSKGELYSAVLREEGIKRPDYIVIIDKEPYFIEVKATGCYSINKEELERLDALKNQSSINVFFSVTDINKEKFDNYNFMTLDTLYNYTKIIEKKKDTSKRSWYYYSKLLLQEKLIPNDINNDKLEEIYSNENHIEIDKYHCSDILRKYLRDNNYKYEE